MKCQGLQDIARKFDRSGFKLADPNLLSSGDRVNSLDFILGSSSLHCLPIAPVTFGSPYQSLYLDSLLGIMLLGPISFLKNNFDCIDRSKNKTKNETVVVNNIISVDKDSFEVNHVVLNDLGKLIPDKLNNVVSETEAMQSLSVFLS